MPLDSPSDSQNEKFKEGAPQPQSGKPFHGDTVRTPIGSLVPEHLRQKPEFTPEDLAKLAALRRGPKAGASMSPDPIPDDEQPEIDDEAVSEVVRKPTRTAGDLSEAGEASGGITLEELLRRVQRIEEHLGIGDPQEPKRLST